VTRPFPSVSIPWSIFYFFSEFLWKQIELSLESIDFKFSFSRFISIEIFKTISKNERNNKKFSFDFKKVEKMAPKRTI
jgi:hypothetical protein